MNPSRLAVLAPGLIGGSIALAATRFFPQTKIVIWTRHPASLPTLRAALPQAEISTDPALIAGSDLVILAAPPSALTSLIPTILPHLAPTTLVTDVASVKETVEKSLAPLLHHKARWLGSHPMAGSEDSGFPAARPDLFSKAPVILTPTAATPAETVRDLTSFWQALGARVLSLSPAQHDTQIARISHLPHCVATALVLAAGQLSLPLAGSGYRDTTRIAAGPAELWTEILLANQSSILAALQDFQGSLHRLTSALAQKDTATLHQIFTEAAHLRRTLPPL